MENAVFKADILIETLSWIHQLRGKVTVTKLGGSGVEYPRSMTHLLLGIIFKETVGVRLVLVRGRGTTISRAMTEADLDRASVQGRRYHVVLLILVLA